jgi:hypothetical protein
MLCKMKLNVVLNHARIVKKLCSEVEEIVGKLKVYGNESFYNILINDLL